MEMPMTNADATALGTAILAPFPRAPPLNDLFKSGTEEATDRRREPNFTLTLPSTQLKTTDEEARGVVARPRQLTPWSSPIRGFNSWQAFRCLPHSIRRTTSAS